MRTPPSKCSPSQMVNFFLDYINTKHTAENFDDEGVHETGNKAVDEELHDGIPMNDDIKKEAPFHIKMVLEVKFSHSIWV